MKNYPADHGAPTKKADWAKKGDRVTNNIGGTLAGTVERVTVGLFTPTATVLWDNGAVGRHTISTLRKVSKT